MTEKTFSKILSMIVLCGTVWIVGSCWANNANPPVWFSYAAIVVAFICGPLIGIFRTKTTTYEITMDSEAAKVLANGGTTQVTLTEN